MSDTELQRCQKVQLHQQFRFTKIGVIILPVDILEVVCRRDDLGCSGAQAVAGALRDDGAATHEVIILIEDQTRPRELPG